MSAPVDVLAVMDAQARHTRQFGGSPSFQTIEAARAAMSELIAAAGRAEAQLRFYESQGFDPESAFALDISALRAALVGVQGGAA